MSDKIGSLFRWCGHALSLFLSLLPLSTLGFFSFFSLSPSTANDDENNSNEKESLRRVVFLFLHLRSAGKLFNDL